MPVTMLRLVAWWFFLRLILIKAASVTVSVAFVHSGCSIGFVQQFVGHFSLLMRKLVFVS
jgi:hypothetical protein